MKITVAMKTQERAASPVNREKRKNQIQLTEKAIKKVSAFQAQPKVRKVAARQTSDRATVALQDTATTCSQAKTVINMKNRRRKTSKCITPTIMQVQTVAATALIKNEWNLKNPAARATAQAWRMALALYKTMDSIIISLNNETRPLRHTMVL